MTKKKIKDISNRVPLFSTGGKKEGEFELDSAVFTGKYNSYLIQQAVLMYQANKRTSNASTKVRSEVRGGGKKPWRQKGTGRARASSTRSPIWRGGGIIFGPHPRSFKYQVPKRIKRLALLHALNSKLYDGNFSVIKQFTIDEPKTKKMKELIDKSKLDGPILIAVDKPDKNVFLASRNLKDVTLTAYKNMNALDVLSHKNFLIADNAVSDFIKDFKKKAKG